MAQAPEPLIILDGDLASLVALACVSDEAVALGSGRAQGPSAQVWLPGIFGESQRDRSGACDRQIALYNARRIQRSEIDDRVLPVGTHGFETQLLLAAFSHAAQAGLERVLWTAHPGRTADEGAIDLERASGILDRALLVEQISALDRPASAARVRIETPHADLSDRQLAELAADLMIPVKTLWWWGGQSDEAQRQRDRWTGLFRETGLWRPAESVVASRG